MPDYRADSRLSKSQLKKSLRRKALERERRQSLLERLEPRHMLTGPELFAIRPDELALLNEGDVLHTAPREFNLLFKGGADIDEATILNDLQDATDDSIRLVRSGGDGVFNNGNDVTVDLGFVGLNDPANPVQIVMRPASASQHNPLRPEAALPDDLYRIEIIGAGSNALENTSQEGANSGLNFSRTFRLDLGAQVVAVVPQPITRTGPGPTNSLNQNRSQIVVYFDRQQLNPQQAQDPKFYRLVDTAITSNESAGEQDKVLLPQSVVYDSVANTATLNFAVDIPEGSYRLDMGVADEPNGTLTTSVSVGTLFQGSPFSYLSYLGDQDGTSSSNNADVDLYKVNLRAGSNFSVTALPHAPGFNVKLRLLNAAGNDITGTATYNDLGAGIADTLTYAVPTTNDYYIEVTSGGGHGSYRLNMSATAAPIPASDTNSSFSQAATNSDLGVLGSNQLVVSSQIEPQTLALPPYPGGTDEPGHRTIQAEDHYMGGSTGVTPFVPGPIAVKTYTFPAVLGTDTQGNPYLNLITETEKQIAREILEIYGSYLGIQFQESTTGGFTIGKGDPGAFRPELAGPNSPSLGGGGGVIIQNNGNSGSTREFGDGFFSTLFHELGHNLGLFHAYDLDAVQGQGVPGPVYPGDYDLQHLMRLHRPDSNDIDLYQFSLTERGKFTAEITAERLERTSHLNSVLTLFDQNHNVIARNDDYYSNDSFLGLELEPGTYYIGVTSTGNVDYNPAIADSGFGGRTDGLYDLALNFTPDTGSILTDTNGTFFDGNADGSPGGVHQFWFETSDYTLFVDKANDTIANQVNGDGSLSNPYDTISDPLGPTQAAFDRAAARIIVPVTGGAGIKDSDRFIIDDGINPPIAFQFDCSNVILDPNCNNDNPPRQIPFEPTDSADVIAAAIEAAINTEIGLNNLTGITVTRDSINSPRLVQLSSSSGASLPKLDISLTPALVNTPNVVRIVGHPGLDQNINTVLDNRPYLIGISQAGLPLADGADFLVPQGTTVMVDAGTLFKMRKSNLDAGTSSSDRDRRGGAIQVLGTPNRPVYFRSFHDDTFGGNSDGVGPLPQPGDFGGIVFRDDSDLEGENIFLNYVNHANMTHGGGKVIVDSVESVFTPVHMIDARPTVTFNSIQASQDAAISANPNSFSDELGRIGPDIYGNLLLNNTINGLFIRIQTSAGNTVDKLSVTGRWDDTDITHVLTENLQIYGGAGGALISTEQQTISVVGGTPTSGTFTLQFTDHNGNSQITAPIQYNAPASVRTNKKVLLRANGATSGTFKLEFQGEETSNFLQFNATAGAVQAALESLGNIAPGDVLVTGGPLNTVGVTIEYTGALAGTTVAGFGITTTGANGLNVTSNTVGPAAPVVTNVSNVIIPIQEHLENLTNVLPGDVIVTGGPLPLNPISVSFVGSFASLDMLPLSPTSALSAGVVQVTTGSEGRSTGRTAGRLAVDPGVVVKLSNSRIEAERGAAQLIAEGTINRPVVFTSIADDRHGGAGTFDVNGNGVSQGTAGDWSGLIFNHVSSGSIDNALIAFGGGDSPIAGTSVNFNAIEVHQARLRLTNSVIESNASGLASSTRDGRGFNQATTVYVRGAQPVIVNNIFQDNAGDVLNINANALHHNTHTDYGRSTGRVENFAQFDVNKGPLIRLNRLGDNGTNGMVVRGELLTTETVWDDTDIVHVLLDEISLLNHHTYSGLRLQSSNEESLVVKLSGATAGFRVGGVPLDIIDRIGGTIQILGTVGHPVVLTSLADDTVGAGFTPDGQAMLDTDNGGSGNGAPGDWNTILLESLSNDRNVAVVRELEDALTDGNDVNFAISNAQLLGVLAPNQKSGDENRRLGFEVHGVISPNDPTDLDMYSFKGTAGTEVWLDIDRTNPALDAVLEFVSSTGVVQAISVDTTTPPSGTLSPGILQKNPQLGGDFYTLNQRDPGMRVVLPGPIGVEGTYFVRVRSNPQPASAVTNLDGGLTNGEYRLQIRLQQVDEFPGSTIRFSDIRYARRGIDVQGVPSHSNLIAEAGETSSSDFNTAQPLDNLLQTDMAALGISGNVNTATNVDWYRFDLNFADIQSIPGVNAGDKTVGVTFDLDYADQAGRGDTTIAVFDENGVLIFVGRESNVANDQPAPGQAPDIDDLSRGSLGVKDPFIGAIQLPVGTPAGSSLTYYVAVSSDRMLPDALDATFLGTRLVANVETLNKRVRLEPVNSVVRVVEDHIGAEAQGYHSHGSDVVPQDSDGIFDIVDPITLATQVKPFSLNDVVLYATTDNAAASAGDNLYTVDPFAGKNYLTRVAADYSTTQNDIQDIVIRSDGRMFGYRRVDNSAGVVGELVELDPQNGAVLSTFSDNILDRSPSPDLADNPQPTDEVFADITTTDDVDALAWERTGQGPGPTFVPTYALYYVVRETDYTAGGTRRVNSKLYKANPTTGSAAHDTSGTNDFGIKGDIQPGGVQYAFQNVSFNPTSGTSANVRIESKIPGVAGDFTLTITRNDAADGVTSVNSTTRTITINLDANPPPSAATLVNLINDNATARQFLTAAVTTGAGGTSGSGSIGVGALNSGDDGTLVPSSGLFGPLRGRVTGVAFGDFDGGQMYGVTDAGEFLLINKTNGTVTRRFDFANAGLPAGFSTSFQGLALGPQNVEGGAYANTIFIMASDGRMYAIDANLTNTGTDIDTTVLANRANVRAILRPIFDSDNDGLANTTDVSPADGIPDGISMRVTGMANNVVGLAFSPLDFNLWHPTMRRGSDAGHGINAAPDASRAPGDENYTVSNPGDSGTDRTTNEGAGGASFYFGFEQYNNDLNASAASYLTYSNGVNSQLGITAHDRYHSDLSSNAALPNSYNFPGGALGALESDSFSLSGYSSSDRPVLYFNYFLETEGHAGSNISGDSNNPFRDSARVYISDDNGATWKLIATNNSQLSGSNPSTSNLASGNGPAAELPGFLSHLSDAGLNSENPRPREHQITQELFDNTGEWRQARIDLSDYANKANLKLRFDFSTAGAFYTSSKQSAGLPTSINSNFGEISDNNRSIRSTNNDHEGFYIDDIIVGFAERGEMVTGAIDERTIGDLKTQARSSDPDGGAHPDRETGQYQLEIRRSGEYAFVDDDGNAVIGVTYDTNDAHIVNLTSSPNLTDTFESPGPLNGNYTAFPVLGPIGANWNRSSTLKPQAGSRSAQAGAITHDQIAPMELTINALTAGAIKFAYSVESELGSDGLAFMIDGVLQQFGNLVDITNPDANPYLATGQIPYTEVTYYFGAGDHTFRWIYSKDGSGTFGRDTAFVDNIVILQGGTGQLGDENRERAQGQLILESNFISRVSQYGINVEADSRTSGVSMPHPGSLINFPQLNDDKLIPGVVIQNNVIAVTGQEGIRFSGDPSTSANAPVPFGRIVNNTIFRTQNAPAIVVTGNASPTIMNNVFARTGSGTPTAVNITGGSVGTEIHSNHFVGYATAGSTPTSDLVTPGLANTFVDLASFNFYPASGSKAIDSSLDQLADRSNNASFKIELGIPGSNIVGPARDVFGQFRKDKDGEDPLGGGSAIFKDRGAIDSADEDQPYAELLFPIDNDAEFLDADRNDTVVYRRNVFLDRFSILLGDGPGPNSPFEGTGVDPRILQDSNGSDISNRIVTVSRNGQPLTEGVDYTLGFSDANDVLLITPLSSLWEPQSVYVITLDNSYDPAAADCAANPQDDLCIGIRDLAGNPLRHNQPDGKTVFTIILGDFQFDYGDAPDASFGTLQGNDGARHVLLPDDPSTPFDETIHLGNRVDADQDGSPATLVDNPALNMADGDDREQSFGQGSSTLSIVGRPPFRFRVPGAGGSGINDEDSFIVNDGANAVTFRFDLGADGTTNVGIPYFNADPAILMAERIVQAINQEVAAGNLSSMTASHLGGGVVQVSGGGVLANVNLSGSGGRLVRSNRLPVSVQVPPAGIGGIADQMTFVIDDGANPPLTFEFDDNNSGLSNPNHIPVPFNSGAYNQVIIANAIRDAINGQAGPNKPLSNLNATAATSVNDIVTVVSRSGSDEDDEDGVTIGKIFVNGSVGSGYTTAVQVISSAAGKLDAWIDFNGNKTFEPEEKIYDAIDVSQGVNNPTPIDIATVATGVLVRSGDTYARFRVSQTGGLFPTGLGVGGEVEDHYLRILENADPIARNPFSSFVDGLDGVSGFGSNQILDVNEDSAPITIDLANIDGMANGTVGDVFSDDLFDDVDIDNGNGDSLVLSILSNSNPNILTASLVGSQLQLTFLPNRNDNFNGPVRVVLRATDHALRTRDQTLTISVKPVNDAPILVPVGPSLLPGTNEDTPSSQFAVSAFAGLSIADVDQAPLFIPQEGIAVTGITGNGTWSYSLDAGNTFMPFPVVSSTSALLLRSADLIQYTPDLANGESPTISYVAWDQTGASAGQEGTLQDPVTFAGGQGNTGAFSIASDTATLVVTSVNDAPVLTPTTPAMPGISEDATGLDFFVSDMLGTSVTDVDNGAVEGIAITARTGNGTWYYLSGVAGFQPLPVLATDQALLLRATDQLRYIPDQKNGEVATLSYYAWDQSDIVLNPAGGLVDISVRGNTTPFSLAGDTAQIAVAPANDAPILAPFNPSLPTTNEDTVTAGATVASIVGNSITDVDNGAIEGIAITSTLGNGNWEYSLDGVNYQPVGAVSTMNALLLRATDFLRYAPDNANGEIASLTYQAWDQTVGVFGGTEATTPNGTTTAFSTASDVLSIVVTSVNDSPVLVPAGPTLAGTDEDTTTPGMTVTSILGGNSSDVDNGALTGIAIIAVVGNGRWEYSTNGGASFIPVGTVSSASALLLRGSDQIRYVPDLKNAETATITYRSWDQSPPTTGQHGTKRDATVFGGTTPFSGLPDTATLHVTALNDAPVLTPIGPSLSSVDEETPTVNYTLSSLLGASITDVDNGAVQGIAVTSTIANGNWEYSIDGTNFFPFGAVSPTSALLLRPQDLIRYVPDTFNGEIARFLYRAWDQTGTTAGQQGTKVDASTVGGLSPFSVALDTIAVDVTHLNDAPILTPAAPALLGTDEDTDSPVQTVAAVLGSSVLDVDNAALKGIAITATTGNGTWQYSLDGTNFLPIGTVTGTSALLLRATDFLRYSPDRINGETATVTYKAWDQTVATGQQGTKVNPSPTGGTAAFSNASDTGSLVVLSVNDQPTVVLGPTAASVQEDSTSGALIFNTANGTKITVADADSEIVAPDQVNGGELIVNLAVQHGTLSMSMAGVTAIDADGSDGTLSFRGLQAAITTALEGLTYNPSQNFNNNRGAETLTITVDDQGGTGAEPPGYGPRIVVVPISVVAVNDQPVLIGGTASFAMDEGTSSASLNTKLLTGVSVFDEDEQESTAPNNTLQITLTVNADADMNNGTLSANAVGGAIISGNGTRIVQISGTEADLIQTLTTLTYRVPNANFNRLNNVDGTNVTGNVFISVSLSDLGHTGLGGTLSAPTETLTVTVEPVNDAPQLTVTTTSFSLNEGTTAASLNTRTLSGVSVSDDDEQEGTTPNNVLQVTIAVLADNDTANGTVSVTTAGGVVAVGNNSATLVLTGLQSEVNATLATLAYRVNNEDFNKINNIDVTNPSGNVFVSVAVSDLGNTGQGGVLTAPVQTVTVTVEPLNDVPEFDLQATASRPEDNASAPGVSLIPAVATNIRPGPLTATDEVGQLLDFLVDVTNVTGNLVFEVAPDIISNPSSADFGALTFRTAKDTNGSAVLEVRLRDTVAGTLVGGNDLTTLVKRVTLTITPVNDIPEFAPTTVNGGNVTVDEDAGLTIVPNWATGIRPGPATATDEINQALEFVVTTDNPGLFSIQPSIDAVTGALQFRAADQANGSANITVKIREVLVPGSESATVLRTINVREVNDQPTTALHVYTMQEDGGRTDNLPAATPLAIAVADLTTNVGTKDSPGPANESTQTLTIVGASIGPNSAQGGTVSLSGDGTQILYTPRVNFSGIDTFTYTIQDNGTTAGVSAPRTATGTITINVTAINDAPIAVNDPPLANLSSYTTDENDVLVVAGVGVIFNDTDEDVQSLVVNAVDTTTLNTKGTVEVLPADAMNPALKGDFRYIPGTQFDTLAQGQTATDRFLYQLLDNGGLTSSFATVTVTIRGQNDAPVTSGISISTTEDAVLANRAFVGTDIDIEPNPQPLTYTIVTNVPAGQGTVVNHGNGTFSFNPGSAFADLRDGESRTVQFTYRATDQRGAQSNLSVVTVEVNGVNDAPTANAGSVVASEDGTTAGSFPASDVDDAPNTLVYRIVSQPSAGAVSIGAGNSFTFNPNGAFDGLQTGQTQQVQFTYGVKDPQNVESTAVMTITVTGVNDLPTAAPFLLNIAEDGGTVTGNFSGNDADNDDDGSTLAFVIVTNVPAGQGSLVNNNNGTVTYSVGNIFQDLPVGQTRDVTFGYRSRDRHGALSEIATATIRVTGTNDAPLAPGLSVSTGENSIRTITLAATDADAGETSSLVYSILGGLGSGQGTLSAVTGNSVTFDPGTNFNSLSSGQSQQVTFSYQAKDIRDAFSIPGTVTITVTGENDAPTAANASLSATEDGPRVTVLLAGDDVDSNDDADSLTYQLVSFPPAGQGTVVLTGTRTLEFNPGSDFQNLGDGQTQQVLVTYRTRDRFGVDSTTLGTVTITVTGQNDAPIVTNLAAVNAVQGGAAVNGNFIGQDPDAADQIAGLLFTVAAQPVEGTVTASPTRGNSSFTFNPGNGFRDLAVGQTRSVTFTYQAADQSNTLSVAATGTATVTGINDAPVSQDVTGVNAQEDGGAIVGNFLADDPDNDETGNGLVYLVVTQPSEGTVTVNGVAGNRQFSFNPGSGFQDLAVGEVRNVTFTYQTRDAHGAVGNTATVTIAVSGRNEAPVADPVAVGGTADDGTISGQFAATDLDNDETGSGLSYFIVSQPSAGSVTTSGTPGDRSFEFDASTGFADLADGETRQVTFTYKARDTHGAESATQTVTVTVTGVNDAPVANPVSTPAVEDGSPVIVTLAGDDVDSDDSPSSLTYSIVTPPNPGQGTLTNNGNGTLTFNPGNAFQSLSVGESAIVTFTYTTRDSHNQTSALATGTITVAGVNDAPLAQPFVTGATEGVELTLAFSTNDLDPDAEDTTATLTYAIVTPSSKGSVTANAGGTFTFKPGTDFESLAAGATEAVTFAFRATDRRGASSGIVTATVTVTGTNDAPVGQSVTINATEHGNNTSGLFNADDVDSDDSPTSLTYALLDTVLTTVINQQTRTVGTLVNNSNGSFTFQPNSGFVELGAGQTLQLTARYRVTDQHGAQSGNIPLTINLTGVNDAPTARNDSSTGQEDTVLIIDAPGVLGQAGAPNSDSDPDVGDTLTVVAFDSVSALGAAVSVAGSGSYRYDPRNSTAINSLAAGFTIEDTFKYTVQDSSGLQSIATVTITVNGANDSPTLQNDNYTANADEAMSVPAAGVLQNDTDPDGNVLTVVSSSAVSNRGAAVQVNADGSFQYFPNNVPAFLALKAGQTLQDSFTYQASDGAGASATATVFITVHGVNDNPTAVDDSYSGSEDNTLTVSRTNGVLRNDVDPDNDNITATVVTGPSNGTLLSFNPDGSFSYRGNANFNGTDTFTYKVSDGTLESAVATVTITVGSVNDAPVAVNDSYTGSQGSTLTVSAPNGVLKNDTDIDGLQMSASVVRAPANGTLTLNTDGSFTFTPAASFSGTDSFTYRVTDGLGGVSNVATVNLSIGSNNQNPWQNPVNRFDVNNDGAISPIDVLVIVNDLNARGSRSLPIPPVAPFVPPPFLDVNGDQSVTPQDALTVINRLNNGEASSGEGEADAIVNEASEATAVQYVIAILPDTVSVADLLAGEQEAAIPADVDGTSSLLLASNPSDSPEPSQAADLADDFEELLDALAGGEEAAASDLDQAIAELFS